MVDLVITCTDGAAAIPNLIQTERTEITVAPDSVNLKVDLALLASTAGLPAPTGADDDVALRVFYKWTVGGADVNTYNKLRTDRSGNIDSRTKYGFIVTHLFRNPGTFPVTVECFVPQGDGSYVRYFGTTDVTVLDPETYYVTANKNTVYVNPQGDNDFSWIGTPVANSTQLNLPDTNKIVPTIDEIFRGPGTGYSERRVVLKPGEHFQTAIYYNNGNPNTNIRNMMWEAGSGGRVTFTPLDQDAYGGSLGYRAFYITNNHIASINASNGEELARFDCRIRGIDFKGGVSGSESVAYDPLVNRPDGTLPANTAYNAFYAARPCNAIIDDCTFDGYARTSTYVELYSSNPSYKWKIPMKFHMNDWTMTNYGGQYPVMLTLQSNAQIGGQAALTGFRIFQDTNVPSYINAPARLIRNQDSQDFYCDGGDMQSPERDNVLLKIQNTIENVPISRTSVVTRTVGEGMNVMLDWGGNTFEYADINTIGNHWAYDLRFFGYHCTQVVIQTAVKGVRIESSTFDLPDLANSTREFTNFFQGTALFTTQQPGWATAKIQLVNCTIVNRRSTVNNQGGTPDGLPTTTGYTMEDINNLWIGDWNANVNPVSLASVASYDQTKIFEKILTTVAVDASPADPDKVAATDMLMLRPDASGSEARTTYLDGYYDLHDTGNKGWLRSS